MSILRHSQIDPYSTSSFLTTASVALNTITFTKGDGSTFPINVAVGSTFPAGNNLEIQYNNNGIFGASSKYRFKENSNLLILTGSFSQGNNTLPLGQYSHAEGFISTASGQYSHAEGYGTIASGLGAHSEGAYGNLAQGWVSHAEGAGTKALGYASHAEGWNTIASGEYSHTEGYLTQTVNNIDGLSYAHAEGEQTLASGVGSHTEGKLTTALGNYSHAAGYATIASGSSQSVIGQFNIANTSQSAFIIGDGIDENNRHNVLFVASSHFEVSASNIYLQGLSTSPETNILVYNTASGQVYYTASSAIGGTSTPSTIISLPTPKILLKGTSTIQWLSGSNGVGGTLNLYRTPQIIANDLSLETLNNYSVFVEMVYYKTNRKGKSWVVPVSNVNVGGTYVNTLETALGVPLKTRGGRQKYKIPGNTIPAVYASLQINRPNHYQVTSPNQVIQAYEYLNGYFTKGDVQYRNQIAPFEDFGLTECTFPYFMPQIGGRKVGAGYGYSNIYSPLYIAFRYILWNANANSGLGDFISGPLSETIAVAADVHPFITNKNNENVSIPLASVNPNYNNNNLKCWFSHKKG